MTARVADDGIRQDTAFICMGCGTQYPASSEPPDQCAICADEREFVGPNGQTWTTLEDVQFHYRNRCETLEPGIARIVTEPHFAIGQQAYLIETAHGNVLWETLACLDPATVAAIEQRGGVAAIAISHPHFFTTMIEWSRALAAPIYLHADHEPWVMRPSPDIQYWSGESMALLPGLTVVRCGGHFPGSCVLHWRDGADGKGALFSGDTIQVAQDRRWVSFMWSYPNLIPLDARAVRGIVASLEPYSYDRVYGGFPGLIVAADAKAAVRRSAERYITHLQGSSPMPQADRSRWIGQRAMGRRRGT